MGCLLFKTSLWPFEAECVYVLRTVMITTDVTCCFTYMYMTLSLSLMYVCMCGKKREMRDMLKLQSSEGETWLKCINVWEKEETMFKMQSSKWEKERHDFKVYNNEWET